MPSFLDRLRFDNLYPSIPRPRGAGQGARSLMNEMNRPFQRSEEPIEMQNMAGDPTMQFPIPTKPMDVIFKPNIGEQAREMAVARNVHGVDLGRDTANEYQRGQLALRAQQLQQQEEAAKSKQELSERRLSDTEKNTLIKEIRENKNLSDAQKIELQGRVNSGLITQRGQIESGQITQRGEIESGHISQRGEQERTTEGVRQTGRESLEEMQARHKKEQSQFESGLPPRTGSLPSQERTELLQRAEQAKNTNPEWNKYIKTVPGGGFMITSPGMITGPSQETYDAINKFIYSPSTPVPVPTSSPAPAAQGKPDPMNIRK